MSKHSRYLLLQVNDGLFPIGGYSHSYGLETYVQQGIVSDGASAWTYIRNSLLYRTCHTDLLAVSMAYEYASKGQIENIFHLEEILTAIKAPGEIRSASHKLGSRFLKAVGDFDAVMADDCFSCYYSASRKHHHVVAYGVFCQAAGAGREEALMTFLYAQASSMVTNCVKLVPLSQSEGQRLLYRCYEVFDQVMERLEQLSEDDLGASAPGFDIRCMQHEILYSRLYMS